MFDSLFSPLAIKAPPDRYSLIFRSCSFSSRSLSSQTRSCLLQLINENKHKLHVLALSHHSLVSLRHRVGSTCAIDSDVPHPLHKESVSLRRSKRFKQWDSMTIKFSGASNISFLFLQLPQIILNARNLLAGNQTALLAVPWMGKFTGLFGNLLLLSYFCKKRENEVIAVQTLGVVSIYIVITQLTMAEAMPLPHFMATSATVGAGLILNFLHYHGKLNAKIWQFWEDFITVGGMSMLFQIMWSTFVPYIPDTIIPGAIGFAIAVAAVTMVHTGKLSEKGVEFVAAISGWTATLLFMWMPVAQMWTNFLNPNNIRGLSAVSMFLAMTGNGLMIPRALFMRDFMWFIGSAWASLFYGYANIVCLYFFNAIGWEFFWASTVGLFSWLGMTLWRDTVVYGYNTPLRSLKELVSGT